MSKASSGNTEVFDKIYKGAEYLKINITTLTDEHKGKSVSQQGIGPITMFMLIGASAITRFMLKEKENALILEYLQLL